MEKKYLQLSLENELFANLFLFVYSLLNLQLKYHYECAGFFVPQILEYPSYLFYYLKRKKDNKLLIFSVV